MTLRDQPDLPGPFPLEAADPGAPLKGPARANVTPLTIVSPDEPSARSRRRRKQQDDVLAGLAVLGRALCTEEEAAEALGLAPETLGGRMEGRTKERVTFDKARAEGLAALRGAQLRLAESSAPMAIFLGRVYLGQSERREVDPGESNEIAQVAQRVRERLAALVADANRVRYADRRPDTGDA